MRHRGLISFFILFAIFFCNGVSYSQSLTISNGLTYLTISQSTDGSWGNETTGTEILPATIAAIEALKALNQTNTPTYSNALVWLQTQGLKTTDYLAERINSLSVAGTDTDLLITYLDEVYTGAWGGDDSPDVDNLDTLLALQALRKINYPDQNIISTALYNLTSNQNPDSRWGFRQGDDSEVYYTALALQTLSQFKTTYDLNTSITSAASYLFTKQNPDGGLGTTGSGGMNPAPSTSTTYETAMAVIALIESGVSDQQAAISIQDALNYLTATQQANGSWDDDPYSTALALRALASVKPNLTISSSDITFSNPAPTVGQPITITAIVQNTGPAEAPSTGSGQDSITVQFYDGNPASGGILIGETTIFSIPAFGSVPASITWTIPSAAAHSIFVTVDPLNTIDELRKNILDTFRGGGNV